MNIIRKSLPITLILAAACINSSDAKLRNMRQLNSSSSSSSSSEEPDDRKLISTTGSTIGFYSEDYVGCSKFSFIQDNPESTILNVGEGRGAAVAVTLARPYYFHGTQAVNSVVVTQQGAIHLDGSTSVATTDSPILNDPSAPNAYDHIPRIAVGHNFNNIVRASQSYTPGVIHLDTGYSNIFSWEKAWNNGIPVLFQAELYDNGIVELRWSSQNGSPPFSLTAGIEDETEGRAYPVTGTGCNDGTCYPQLSDQCRRFQLALP